MSEFKTKDGLEATLGKWYFLENGQAVVLEDCVKNSKGDDRFLVIPYYEGESMTVSCDGGMHCEYTCDYEHEGEEMLVKAIFKKEPMEKIGERYKRKSKEIELLSIAHGELKLNILKAKQELSTEKLLIEKQERDNKSNIEEYKKNKKDLELLTTGCCEKRQELSELEDSIDLTKKEACGLTNGDELIKLRKIEFKMQCLEAGGVDNWTWYDESLNDYRERYPND